MVDRMHLRLIDGIGPFFREVSKRRINWSKILFRELDPKPGAKQDEYWREVEAEMRVFTARAKADAYTALTLDDVSHLTHHPLHGGDLSVDINHWRARYRSLMKIIEQAGLQVFLTTDVLTLPRELEVKLNSEVERENYYLELLASFLDDWPQVAGVILRLGECDGVDVKDQFRSHLFLKTPKQANRFLHRLAPIFQSREKALVVRTWTVGAHPIGDLIWRSSTLKQTFRNLGGSGVLVSMKYGDSDFFRYLELSEAFEKLDLPKIVEFQTRPEYEGAGEYPSFLGWDFARLAEKLRQIDGVVGLSAWCQTGGWHAFRRRTYLDSGAVWGELNTAILPAIVAEGKSVEAAVESLVGPERIRPCLDLLKLADQAIKRGLYIEEFAERELFFRRVRIPPLLHVYWDCIFFNHATRKILRHFVKDPERALADARAIQKQFPEMRRLAIEAKWPEADIIFMQDSFELMALAREYYFGEFNDELVDRIKQAKSRYKQKHPRGERQRYRVKTDFQRFELRRKTLGRALDVFLRQRRGYRLFDRVVTLNMLGWFYRCFGERSHKKLPKFMRKSAMGIDSVLR